MSCLSWSHLKNICMGFKGNVDKFKIQVILEGCFHVATLLCTYVVYNLLWETTNMSKS